MGYNTKRHFDRDFCENNIFELLFKYNSSTAVFEKKNLFVSCSKLV